MSTIDGMKNLFEAIFKSNLENVGFDNQAGYFYIGDEAIHEVARFWFTAYTNEYILEGGDDLERFSDVADLIAKLESLEFEY